MESEPRRLLKLIEDFKYHLKIYLLNIQIFKFGIQSAFYQFQTLRKSNSWSDFIINLLKRLALKQSFLRVEH